jgi:hypothetical protein
MSTRTSETGGALYCVSAERDLHLREEFQRYRSGRHLFPPEGTVEGTGRQLGYALLRPLTQSNEGVVKEFPGPVYAGLSRLRPARGRRDA